MNIQEELSKLAEEANPVSPQASLSMSNYESPSSVTITVLAPNGIYVTGYGESPKKAFMDVRARISSLSLAA